MTPDSLDLTGIDDASFQRLYAERIEPCFASNEEGRKQAVKAFWTRLAIGAPVLIALAIAAAALWREAQIALFIGLGGGAGLAWFAYSPIDRLAKQVKTQSLGSIAEAMRASYQLAGFEPPALERAKALGLLPSYNRSSFEDLFCGTHRGASFDLYEAHLKQHRRSGKNSSTVTVFRGQIIRLRFPRAFAGVTVVRRDAGMFNFLNGLGELKRVGLVDSKFEKVFEVYGTDQVEARFLVHPAFMERLLELEGALRGKRIRCAFESGDLIICIEGGNLFEPGSLFQPLADPMRARRIVDELASIMRVMDAVLTAQAQR